MYMYNYVDIDIYIYINRCIPKIKNLMNECFYKYNLSTVLLVRILPGNCPQVLSDGAVHSLATAGLQKGVGVLQQMPLTNTFILKHVVSLPRVLFLSHRE